MPSGFSQIMERIIRQIWEEQATEAGFAPELVQAYGQQFSNAVTKGYGKDFFEMDWQTPDYEKLKALHIDAWKFASAKGNDQMQKLSGALRKPDGTMRTFEEFRAETVLITGQHLSGLKAEYNTAVASAQMASKWQTIQAQKELYPYLQYIAVEDNHISQTCFNLANQVHHVDSPFWQKWYPPNHYNCRSSVKQLREMPKTDNPVFEEPKVPEEFKQPMAMILMIMPKTHRYYSGVDLDVLFAKTAPYLPYRLQFEELPISKNLKGVVRKHFMVNAGTEHEYERILKTAIDKAKEGHEVDILPNLNPNKWKELRKIIFHDAIKNKSPELRINQILAEEEHLAEDKEHNFYNIARIVEKGRKQANYLIINLEKPVNNKLLRRIANAQIGGANEFKVIEFRMPKKVKVYKSKKP